MNASSSWWPNKRKASREEVCCSGAEWREAHGVRGACSRFGTTIGRATAPPRGRQSKIFARLGCEVAALCCAGLALTASGAARAEQTVDLAEATLVTRAGQLPKAEQAATQVLVEELEKRAGKRLPVSTSWPKDGLVVVVTSGLADAAWGHAIPKQE